MTVVDTEAAEQRWPRHDDLWTPASRVFLRLSRVTAEEPGSMQHFHAGLLVGEVILKLHALAALSLLGDHSFAKRLEWDLSRADSAGTWSRTLRESLDCLRADILSTRSEPVVDWAFGMRTWLTQQKGRDDASELTSVFTPLAELSSLLSRSDDIRDRRPTPLEILRVFVEIRNKTTAHRAYGSDFWSLHVKSLAGGIEWLIRTSPLWTADLVLPLRRGGQLVGRRLRGLEPHEVVSMPRQHAQVASGALLRPIICLDKDLIGVFPPLVQVEPSSNLTYFANGGWRDSDSSAEFLCHSLEATGASEGSMRLELPMYSIRPQGLPRSETEGLDELRTDTGVVLNNLPAQTDSYVRRAQLEDRLMMLLRDTGKRHVVNVRGIGGIGKTSMLLELCHDLAIDPERCPYHAIIWMSARDIDLRLSGAREVRRGSESMHDVWSRFARLFDADDGGDGEVFEDAMRGSDPYLVVLDNFETFDEQDAAYRYLDELVHPPSKVVITSRHVFTDDYGFEVRGMSFDEGRELLLRAARQASREPLMTDDAIQRIYDRAPAMPAADADAAGRVYVAWQDSRFRREDGVGNDIVFASSGDGIAWSDPTRIRLPQTAQYFLPALAVDPATSGKKARLAVAFYSMKLRAGCTLFVPGCAEEIDAWLVESKDAGATWAAARRLNAEPMPLEWLAETTLGRMLGDYISVSFTGGKAVPVLALSGEPSVGGFTEAVFASRGD